MSVKEYFHEVIDKGGAKIKLLGDSITHGVGGTGFKQDGEHIVSKFNRNPNGYCWAKQFKEYLGEKYGASVTNNACTGTIIEFIILHFNELVSEDDDLVICTIGTNNRHQYMNTGEKKSREEMLNSFRDKIRKLHSLFNEAGKRVIFMANIPAAAKNEEDGADYWRILHMNDIRDCYKAEKETLGFELISLYDLMTDYCNDNGVSLDSLLKDGLHPNDEGYDVMFGLIKKELGL